MQQQPTQSSDVNIGTRDHSTPDSHQWRERLRLVFGFDPRSLALFRVLLGLLILTDLILRSRDLTKNYTDLGVLPRDAWTELTHRWAPSLHAASGELWWQIILFAIAAIAALALTVGYRTRLANFVSLVLLASLMNRNGLLLQAGDQLLVVMCFWALFLPLGMRFSIDAALQPRLRDAPNAARVASEPYRPYLSVATVAVTFQILYLYFFTALLKTGSAWRETFDGAFYAVSLQHFATPIGEFASHFPQLLKVATVFVLAVEFVAPFLVIGAALAIWFNSFDRIFTLSRLVGLALLASLHVGFLLMLHIGLFPLIDFMSLSLLVPGLVWTYIALLGRKTSEPSGSDRPDTVTLHYDVDCGFCLKMCLILREFLLPGHAQIKPAQDDPVIGEILERENSWVVTDAAGQPHVHWDAMRLLFRQRIAWRPVYWLLSIPPLPWLGHKVYRAIADNRDGASRFTARFLPWREQLITPTILGGAVALYWFYIVTAYNVWEMPGLRGQMPKHVEFPARVARINQRWDMFAPFPLTTSSYPVVTGLLRSGERVELFETTSSDEGWEPPSRFFPLYGDYRTRKYMGRVDSHSNTEVKRSYGSYLCRTWNNVNAPTDREQQLGVLEVRFVKLRTNTIGEPKERTERMAWRHWCYPEFRNRRVFDDDT